MTRPTTALSDGRPSWHRFPVRTPVRGNGVSSWADSNETYEALATFDHPRARAAQASLDRALNSYSRYSGHHDDVHAHALHVLWALRNPDTLVGRTTLATDRS